MKTAKLWGGLVVAVSLLVVGVTPVLAENTPSAGLSGYAADAPIQVGSVVVLTGKDSNAVRVATQKDSQNMFGVVIDRALLPFAVSNEAIENETYVAVSGAYSALVSTQNGAIASGDYLTLSALDGVLMKAGTDEVTVFGRANQSFDGKGVSLGSTTLKDSAGGEQSVVLGSVPVTIDIKNNPNHKSTKADVPPFLERVGQAIAEKEVSPVRIYISAAIAVVSVIAAIAVIYAGVRSGVISIGRNTMSKKSIFKALMQVILTSLLILIIGIFAVYLLLKL